MFSSCWLGKFWWEGSLFQKMKILQPLFTKWMGFSLFFHFGKSQILLKSNCFNWKTTLNEISDLLALIYVFQDLNFFFNAHTIVKISIDCKISLFSLYRNRSLNVIVKNDQSAVTYGFWGPQKLPRRLHFLLFTVTFVVGAAFDSESVLYLLGDSSLLLEKCPSLEEKKCYKMYYCHVRRVFTKDHVPWVMVLTLKMLWTKGFPLVLTQSLKYVDQDINEMLSFL